MNSREKILSAIQSNQPRYQELTVEFKFESIFEDLYKKFADTLSFVGGKAIEVSDYEAIKSDIQGNYQGVTNIATTIPELRFEL